MSCAATISSAVTSRRTSFADPRHRAYSGDAPLSPMRSASALIERSQRKPTARRNWATLAASILSSSDRPPASHRFAEIALAAREMNELQARGLVIGSDGDKSPAMGAPLNAAFERLHRFDQIEIVGDTRCPVTRRGRMMGSVLGTLYMLPWWRNLLVITMLFTASALVLTTALYVTDCTESTFGKTFMLSVAHVISFGEEGDARTSDEPGCVLVTTLGAWIALIMQALLFAVVATRFLNPESTLMMPTRLCVTVRDGQQLLVIRFMHPAGHLISRLSVQCLLCVTMTSEEGERYCEQRSVPFGLTPNGAEMASHMWMPLTLYHSPDACGESSPLWAHRHDLMSAEGHLLFIIDGYDEVLRTPICERVRFRLSDCVRGRYADVCLDAADTPVSSADEAYRARFWRTWYTAARQLHQWLIGPDLGYRQADGQSEGQSAGQRNARRIKRHAVLLDRFGEIIPEIEFTPEVNTLEAAGMVDGTVDGTVDSTVDEAAGGLSGSDGHAGVQQASNGY